MSLKDLVIHEKHITEDLLEEVLVKFVRLVVDNREVLLLPEAETLLVKQKVLLYLAGIYAWDLIESKEPKTQVSNSQIENALKVRGNTIRPVLKKFRELGFVESEEDGVVISYDGVKFLKTINVENVTEKQLGVKHLHIKNGVVKATRVAGRNHITNCLTNSTLDQIFVENLLVKLRNIKNIDKYLLALYTAKTQLNLEGLTPGEINMLLTNPPLKLPKMFTTNISRDLGRNFKTKIWVAPFENSGKSGLVYRLTQRGEERVKEVLSNNS